MKTLTKKFKRLFYTVLYSNIATGEFLKIFRFFKVHFISTFFDYPKEILLETVNICNIRCELCPLPPWELKRSSKVMSETEFSKALKNIGSVGYKILFSFTGEPLLNKELFSFVKQAGKKGFMTMVDSNGTSFNDTRIAEMVDAKLDLLNISLDGMSSETYLKMRTGSNFKKVIENIEKIAALESTKPLLEIQFIVNSFNEHEVEKVKEFIKKNKIYKLYIKPISINEHLYNNQKIKQLKNNYLPSKSYRREAYKNDTSKSKTCPFLKKVIILSNGDVVICCTDFKSQYIMGNIFKDSLKDIWNSPKYKKIRKSMKRRALPICNKCPM